MVETNTRSPGEAHKRTEVGILAPPLCKKLTIAGVLDCEAGLIEGVGIEGLSRSCHPLYPRRSHHRLYRGNRAGRRTWPDLRIRCRGNRRPHGFYARNFPVVQKLWSS